MTQEKNGGTQESGTEELQGFFVIPLSDVAWVNVSAPFPEPDKRDRIPISPEMLSAVIEQLARRLRSSDPERYVQTVESLVHGLPDEVRQKLDRRLRSHRNLPGLLKDHPLWDEVTTATKEFVAQQETEDE